MTFLQLIQNFCRQHKLSEKHKPVSKTATSNTPRQIEVGEAYNAGQSVPDLTDEYVVQPGTILDHLWKYYQETKSLRADETLRDFVKLSEAEQQAALAKFAELGTAALRPVYDALNGTVNYDDLKVMRLVFVMGGK